MKCPKIIVGIASVLAVSSCAIQTASAETMWMYSGLLCETQSQTAEFLQSVSYKTIDMPVTFNEGCGRLMRPVLATWEVVSTFEDSFAKATIIKIESPEFGVKYSYIKYIVLDGQGI